MSIFTQGLSTPEGPIWLPGGDLMVVEMGPERGCITRIGKDGANHRQVAKTGRPNGLALDRQGFVWVAETAMRALLRMTIEGRYDVIAKHCDGRRFMFLNDLAFAPNGDLYLTDSGVLFDDLAPGGELNPEYRDLKYDGCVFRVDVATGAVEMVDSGYQFTNGVAFGPDGDLYVTETLSGMIYRYRMREGRPTGRRQVFGNVVDWSAPAGLKGPDGMKFDAAGNLYVAVFGQGDVTMLNRNGGVERRIKTQGGFPSNLVFGMHGEKRIYVTEGETGTIQMLDVEHPGYPLHG